LNEPYVKVSNWMQLFAKTSDPFLLKKSIHRDGTTFYHLCNDGTVEVAYFSGSRTIHFKGQIPHEQLEILVHEAFQVDKIEIDEITGVVKAVQTEPVTQNSAEPVNACPECGKQVDYDQQRMGFFCPCGWSHYKVSDGRWVGTKPPKTH
jgi:hypothetical protein